MKTEIGTENTFDLLSSCVISDADTIAATKFVVRCLDTEAAAEVLSALGLLE